MTIILLSIIASRAAKVINNTSGTAYQQLSPAFDEKRISIKNYNIIINHQHHLYLRVVPGINVLRHRLYYRR